MVLIESILTIANLTSLAQTIFEFWRTASEQNDRRLDRRQALYLQQQQHRHERALAQARTNEYQYVLVSVPTETASPLDVNNPLLTRLQLDAQKLSDLGIDVAYEYIGDLYGIAIPIRDDLTIGFVLAQQYPQQAPLVLIRENDELDQISFDTNVWQEDIFLADILVEIAIAYYSTEAPSRNEDTVPVEPPM
jgi:hypothetical protein